jgi:hypothetical protein
LNLPAKIQLLERIRISKGRTAGEHAGATAQLRRILASAEKHRVGTVREREWLANLVREHARELYLSTAGLQPPEGNLQYRRCSKPNCRCAGPSGELHGPYIYISVATKKDRTDGRPGKAYSSAYGGKR